jgi:hypothetical protein
MCYEHISLSEFCHQLPPLGNDLTGALPLPLLPLLPLLLPLLLRDEPLLFELSIDLEGALYVLDSLPLV